MAGPGRATSGRPTLQTSSNQHDSNRLARTSVTNVVNPSPKTSIFTEKAIELTTFVTTRTEPHVSTPGTTGVEGAGGSGGHGRASRSTTPSRRLACGDLAGGRARRRPEHQRSRKQQAQSQIQAEPPVWRAPEGSAAVPVGGGGAWPGFETTRRAEGSQRGRLAGGPPPTGTHSGRARRRPEHQRRHKHHHKHHRTEKPQNSS